MEHLAAWDLFLTFPIFSPIVLAPALQGARILALVLALVLARRGAAADVAAIPPTIVIVAAATNISALCFVVIGVMFKI